jgi:hypothetical protein
MCTSQVPLEEGGSAHQQIIQSGWDLEVFVVSSLGGMNAKCGSMQVDAWRVLNKIPCQDVVTWNGMIS